MQKNKGKCLVIIGTWKRNILQCSCCLLVKNGKLHRCLRYSGTVVPVPEVEWCFVPVPEVELCFCTGVGGRVVFL